MGIPWDPALRCAAGCSCWARPRRVECSDRIPEKYDYLFEDYQQPEFEPHVICAVDVADPRLLGDKLSVYADRVELCIDHHGSNTGYARRRPLDAGSAAIGGAHPGAPAGMGRTADA